MNINISEILKDKPKGTKLYSPILGECSLIDIENNGIINIDTKSDGSDNFFPDGKYSTNGEVMLFPSKEMRDWSKFAWKKGDVLVSNDGKTYTIFEEYAGDLHTYFVGKHSLYWNIDEDAPFYTNIEDYDVADFTLADSKKAQRHIEAIERKLGGKLNMETLKIEPAKPKCEFKPFDKVLGRNEGDVWEIDFFSRMADDLYFCLHGMYEQCIPYNEETAKLIGTTNDYRED